MKIAKLIRSSVAALTLCAIVAPSMAMPVISLQPASSNVGVGGSVFIDLVWDGAGSNYIGDFDIDIVYDDSIAGYAGATIDPQFGIDSLGCIICGDGSTAGVVDLFAVSLDSVADLIANQDGLGNNFILATMEFVGLQDGLTDLSLSGVFGNEFGLSFDHILRGGEICVGDCEVVPLAEPATLPLLALGLIAVAFGRRKARSIR